MGTTHLLQAPGRYCFCSCSRRARVAARIAFNIIFCFDYLVMSPDVFGVERTLGRRSLNFYPDLQSTQNNGLQTLDVGIKATILGPRSVL